jgi:NADH dehydrogenase/NADH:ubiquinone oxidoreductase subunit G
MIDIVIDGRKIQAEQGASLLQTALDHGIEIPHLCYHPAVKAYGACRLCLVEVSFESHGRKRTKLTTSCNYPVLPGIEVVTDSERIRANRKGVLELLAARAPKSKRIGKLAAEYGIDGQAYPVSGEECILCGLCIQVCRDIMGVEALGFIGRGDKKDVGTPFEDLSRECIGCASCASVCPTQCIEVIDEGTKRELPRWRAVHKLVLCRLCGKAVATEKHLAHLKRTFNLDADLQSVCPTCRRSFYAQQVVVERHM